MEIISNGAHFLKADLHIHSYGDGGSYDVDDYQMNPQNIVADAPVWWIIQLQVLPIYSFLVHTAQQCMN